MFQMHFNGESLHVDSLKVVTKRERKAIAVLEGQQYTVGANGCSPSKSVVVNPIEKRYIIHES